MARYEQVDFTGRVELRRLVIKVVCSCVTHTSCFLYVSAISPQPSALGKKRISA